MISEIMVLGLVILVGFIGNVFYKYTKIPESLFMILIGLAIGPVFGLVKQGDFINYAPLVVTITLVIVLLDAGIQLNVIDTLSALGKALRFTLIVLFLSTFFVGSFMFLLGWELLHALLIGVVSSGTTTIVVTFLLPRLNVPNEIKQILVMESIINDVTLLTAAVIIVQMIQIKSLNLGLLTSALVGPVAMGILSGAIFTLVWVNVLWKFYKDETLTYVFTLGVLFLLHSFVELIGGNGAIAVLVLSLSLGNLPVILKEILEGEPKTDFLKGYTIVLIANLSNLSDLRKRFDKILSEIKDTQVDFAFFIKNLFFVYLGIIFDSEKLGLILVGTCLGILSLVAVSRYASVRLLALSNPKYKQYATLMTTMMARGFTATFVALLPSTQGVEIPQFKELVLITVLFSTIITIFGSIIYERRLKQD